VNVICSDEYSLSPSTPRREHSVPQPVIVKIWVSYRSVAASTVARHQSYKQYHHRRATPTLGNHKQVKINKSRSSPSSKTPILHHQKLILLQIVLLLVTTPPRRIRLHSSSLHFCQSANLIHITPLAQRPLDKVPSTLFVCADDLVGTCGTTVVRRSLDNQVLEVVKEPAKKVGHVSEWMRAAVCSCCAFWRWGSRTTFASDTSLAETFEGDYKPKWMLYD